MNALAKTLLAGVAGAALLTSAAVAQNSESDDSNTSILDGVTDTVDSSVDSTVDAVDDVTGNVTNDLGVSDTVDDVTGSVTGGDVDGGDVTGGDTSVGSIGTFSDLLNAISAGNGDVSDFADVSEVSFVDVGEAFNDFDLTALNDALSGNDTNISDLQNEISGNSALSDALSNNDIDVSDVVALENHNDGSLTIYTYQQD
ncbi:hypothetical protein V6617_06635 [Pelagibacterium nitratireducens]|uniref:Uncharacterized protein n=1 Tax=Pelagibacterium nitratireducens TaxID=1046114 RepID=A0ABZ2I9F7_9HYPH